MTSRSQVGSTVRKARKRWQRASSWRPKRPGEQTVDVRDLISPLRFDVVVRAQFFDFLSDNRGRTLAELQHAALDQPYFTWFRDVECARFFPELLTQPDRLQSRFEARVAQARTTLQSYEQNGFDRRWPVTLLRTRAHSTTDTGLPIGARLHIGDGCHRLALLLRDGRDLEPGMYLVRSATGPVIDNTAVLLRSLPVTPEQYLWFLSAGSVPGPHHDVADLRSELALRHPERVDELDTFARVHLPLTTS